MKWLVLVVAVVGVGCSRPSVKDCETLCKKYSELAYKERELQTHSTEEVEAAWKEYLASDVFKKGLHNCVNDCRYDTKSDVKCVEAASTLAQAKSCIE